MFKKTLLKETVVIHPSELGCIDGSVATSLYKMYIDLSSPKLGIGLGIENIDIKSIVIDPDSGYCIANVTFELNHVLPSVGDIIKKPHDKSTHVVEFDETTEKIAISFEN